MIIDIIIQIAMSFVGTIGFSILFNVPKKELVFCGIGGSIGWMLHYFMMDTSPILGTFAGTAAVAAIARHLAYRRKMPVTIYMIPGIIPLVPGAGIYFTMFYIVMGEYNDAMLRGVATLAAAGVIALGLLAVLSLPRRLFGYKM